MDDFRQVIDLDQLTSDDTITLARTAAEAIRGLNWTTNTSAGLDQRPSPATSPPPWPWPPPGSARPSPRSPAT